MTASSISATASRPFFRNSSVLDSPSVRRSRNTSGNRGGWTEHLIEELGGGPKSLDDLVATALTKWPDREESDIRTRLRVTLHAMQGRRVERDGDKWKVKLL